jgi:mRNA-decapping enzyme 1B
MDELTKLRINISAIQKVDPYAKNEIIDSCPHVAYYKYINNAWEKTEIEGKKIMKKKFLLIISIFFSHQGSFFIYSRVAEPFHSIFINNRLNTNSLVEPITNAIELQSQPPFLLYRNNRQLISGFWFYCKEDCVRIHALLEKLIKTPKADQAAKPENKSFSLVRKNFY